ncbi:MAG TPA: AMP-binding protein, partial [Planctomycetaceae bacterium]
SGTTGRPLRWLDTPESWSWFANCWGQIFRLAGLRPEDRIFFPFSFGPFIGFWAAFEGAGRLGNLVIPGGGMSSEARLAMIADTQATVLCCTPTYALRLAEVAAEQGIELASSSVRLIVVAGEPGGNVPAVRDRIEAAWGATVIDHWGMTELGSLATAAAGDRTGLYMLEAECIAEVLDPRTLKPVPPGELGELVVTNLGRVGSPLIRYRTGDLVRVGTVASPVGLDLLRLEGGILGRSDDMVTIRGNNVFPTSVEAVVREFADVAEFRIVVRTVRAMKHLRLELEPAHESLADGLPARVGRAIKDRLNFTAEVVCVPCGSLPRFELKGRRLVREDLPQSV